MQQAKVFDSGFSTADVEYPSFTASNGTLSMTFRNWQEETVHVEFRDVHAFKWQEAEQLLPNEPYDGACKICNSIWLIEHGLQDSNYQHYSFNFNACGKLEVLCASFVVLHN